MISKQVRIDVARLRKEFSSLTENNWKKYIRDIKKIIRDIEEHNYSKQGKQAQQIALELKDLKKKTVNYFKNRNNFFFLRIVEGAFENNIINVCVVNYKFKELDEFFNNIHNDLLASISSH